MWLTCLSDYGHEDAFLGVCKGVIARTAPEVRILDVLHLVTPQDVEQGAATLASVLPYLPSPSVHLALVDPFRPIPVRGIAVRTADGSFFVSPDNGLTSQAWGPAGGAVEARLLDNAALWHPNPSRTFRGRDVFAPVAARLAVCEDSVRTVTVAVNQGSAAKALRAGRAEPLVISRLPQAPPVQLTSVRMNAGADDDSARPRLVFDPFQPSGV